MGSVLLITADQMRADCMSGAGHPAVKTPRLDALAAAGALFSRHYGVAAPCGPARASLLTGLYTANHRSVDNGVPLPARLTNIALEVRRAGLDAFLIGYTDTTAEPDSLPPQAPDFRHYQSVLRGFHPLALWRGMADREWLAALARRGYDAPMENEMDVYLPAGMAKPPREFVRLPAKYAAADSDTAFAADRALDFIRAARGDFLLHLIFLRPHPPFIAPAPYHEMYPDDGKPPIRSKSRAAEAARHPFLAAFLNAKVDAHRREHGALYAPADDETPAARAAYYGLVSEVDFHIGRILDGLSEAGRADDTLVIFTSDHGEIFGDYYCWDKGGWFDGSQRIPLIIRDPKAAAGGARIDEFTESVDILPTILRWLDLPPPSSVDGMSLLPFIRGESPPPGWRDAAMWEYDFRRAANSPAFAGYDLSPDDCALIVRRERRWKYVHFNGLPPLLFDSQADPGEFNNLAEKPAHAAERARLAGETLSWRMRHCAREWTDWRISPDGMVGGG